MLVTDSSPAPRGGEHVSPETLAANAAAMAQVLALPPSISGNSRLILLVIAGHIGNRGGDWAELSIRELGRLTGTADKRTVVKLTRRLERAGFIESDRGGFRLGKRYRIAQAEEVAA